MEKTIIVPETLNDMTVEQFMKIQNLDKTDTEFMAMKIMEIFCDVSPNEYKQIPAKDVYPIVNNIVKVLQQQPEVKTRFVFEGIEYGLFPNMNKLEFGALINLEETSKLNEQMAILYRPILEKQNEKYSVMPYDDEFVMNVMPGYKNKFKNLPLDIGLGFIVFFFRFKKGLLESFSKYFGESSTGFKTEKEANFHQKWGWYGAIFELCQGDPTKFDTITMLPYVQVLTYLEWLGEKNELQSWLIKQEQRKIRNGR